ncbi:MAG: SpoIVB peptidase S55 domain-containing protein [Candidatus Aminicenantales bacterium]
MEKKYIKIFFGLFLSLFIFADIGEATTILPLNEVKAGMKGIGKSVFEQNKIEEFDVEILGILHNVQPKRNIILAKLKGKMLDKAGVMQGMSGSPVYIDGRLVGAIAYSFPYAKEAIAGITPIGEMIASSREKEPRSSFTPRQAVKKYLSLQELFEINKEFFESKSSLLAEGQSFRPLNIPLVLNGFSSEVLEKAKSFFYRLGFSPVMAGPAGQNVEKITPPQLKLAEGDPVGVQLISGDLSMAAIGTVTYVDGNKILAFGHPVYNLGSVDYAMTKAKVITIVPSFSTSFKLAVPDVIVGRFSQDRTSGLFGEVGKIPRLVPLNIKILNDKGQIRDFKIKVVEDKILTPFLINFSLANLLTVEERSTGDLSLEAKGNIYLENGMSVHIEDLYSGNFDSSITNLANLMTAVVYFLTNNEFEKLGIHRIDLNIRSSEEVKLAYLEKVWLNKYEAFPGERIHVKIYSRTFRGKSVIQEVGLPVPHLPTGAVFDLVIADAASMHQIELSQYQSQAFIPRSLNQLIRILSNLRKNNRIYFKIIASKPGLFLKGEEMPNLPPTMKFMFSSPRAAASSPTELTKSTLREYQYPVPYVFKGLAVIPIKIKK